MGKKLFLFTFTIFTILLIIMPAFATPPASPIKTEITSDKTTVVIGEEFRLILKVMTDIDTPNTTMRISLPDDIKLVSGDLSWHGNLPKNMIGKLDVMVKAEKGGKFRIIGSAGDSWFGDEAYVDVCAGRSIIEAFWVCSGLIPILINPINIMLIGMVIFLSGFVFKKYRSALVSFGIFLIMLGAFYYIYQTVQTPVV